MDKLQFLVLQAVRARAEYDDALQELAVEATGTTLISASVVHQIEELARDKNTTVSEIESLALLAQGHCH